ncbi:LysM peptidoglycan-binding domain-containing protein [Tepidibacillus sp. LV47]|uniref:LysM peptidoglycan-binding domain-containing protein n=1 Tax=Tepidibacillus sp. LV47 TaxID=3398228 RepID=UPI003AAEDCBC
MTYIVQPGDNLWSIAQRFGTTPEAIMRANGITNPNLIYVGQPLFIPVPPTPSPRTLVERVERLERKVNRLERRVSRLEQGRVRKDEEEG